MTNLTDLELIDKFCEECIAFINPKVYREINNRGLYHIVNRLPNNIQERKAIARARLKVKGAYIGDPEIEMIADSISRIKDLKTKLSSIPASEVSEILILIEQITEHAVFVRDYYKSNSYAT